MHIIKLNAIDSTNTYLRHLSNNESLEDYTTIMAKHQTNGRGQRGNNWNSEKGKNLTISIYKNLPKVNLEHKFYISMVVSLAIWRALSGFNLKNLKIKWPNDILTENKKIGGILIENIIKKGTIQASIIGIGLNVNQTKFTNMPRASSLRLLTGRNYDLDELVFLIHRNLEYYFQMLMDDQFSEILNAYNEKLFRRSKPSTFKNAKGELFSGYINGVSEKGCLKVILEDNLEEEFDLKEITLMY